MLSFFVKLSIETNVRFLEVRYLLDAAALHQQVSDFDHFKKWHKCFERKLLSYLCSLGYNYVLDKKKLKKKTLSMCSEYDSSDIFYDTK